MDSRLPPTTLTRSAIWRFASSSPTASIQVLKTGLRSRFCSRCSPLTLPFGRISVAMRVFG